MKYSNIVKTYVGGVIESLTIDLKKCSEHSSKSELGKSKIIGSLFMCLIFLQLIAAGPYANAATTYSLTIQSPSGSGSTSPGTGTRTYSRGTNVKVSAYPSSGWRLDHWIKDGSDVGDANPIYVSMSSSHTLIAVFVQAMGTGGGKPYVQGITLRAPGGAPLLLIGFNIKETYQESDFAWIASKGYNGVRVTVRWSTLEPSEGKINWTPLDNTLAWCQKYELYAIIDMHQMHWSSYFTSGGAGDGFPKWLYDNSRGYGTYDPLNRAYAMREFFTENTPNGALFRDMFKALWQKIVTRYKANPYVWAYEIINEPMVGAANILPDGDNGVSVWKFYNEMVAAIRAIDPNTIISLQSYNFGSNQAVSYPNIVWSRSFYKYEGTTKTAIDASLNECKAEFNTKMGVPYIISEIGVKPADMSIADGFLTTSLNEYKALLNGGTGCWNYWQYAKGTSGGYQGPRNSDGSDSWVQTILAKQ